METPQWWKEAICYQIYPRSFADSNGDGQGDIQGIISKLDYLQWLGITALWISPIYPSPNRDWGYDATNFTDVHPDFGTLADVDELIAEAHQRNIRILLDFVPNHSSDQHEWFKQSRSSKDNPYRDWYIWRDGQDGKPPNKWESIFGGPAWTYDADTDQYYYHFFLKEQPDLNWRNPDVQDAMLGAMRFWLERGIDGFRMDAIAILFEDKDLNDYTESTMSLQDMYVDARMEIFDDWPAMVDKIQFQSNLPEVNDVVKKMRALVDEYDAIMLGETDDISLYGNGEDGLNSMFNFGLLGELNAERLRKLMATRLPELPDGAWEGNTFSNHDRIRSYTVFKDEQLGDAAVRLALALVMFLKGTPVFYYGEELGMENLRPASLEVIKDSMAHIYYEGLRKNRGLNHDEAFVIAADYIGRDGCRTPMQWDTSPNAGFTSVDSEPWLPIHPNYSNGINVEAQSKNADSMLNYFCTIAHLRNNHPVLQTGEIEAIETEDEVFAFKRKLNHEQVFVIFNISSQSGTFTVPNHQLKILFSTHQQDENSNLQTLTLAPYEVVLAERGY